MRFQHPGRDPAKVEALAAGEHRYRHGTYLGRRENEFHMLRRLLQRLQQGIERIAREHVHFIDDIDLEARRNRAVAYCLNDLADIVHAGMGGRIHFDDIDMAVGGDGRAGFADPAGLLRRRLPLAVRAEAVDRAGEDPRCRRLADAAHAGEHEGMRNSSGPDRIGENAHQRFLADKVAEGGGPVFAGQHPVGGRSLAHRG